MGGKVLIEPISPIDIFNTIVTVADATQISRGVALKLTDPRTGIAMTASPIANPLPSAGVAAQEKVASNGATTLAVWKKGIFSGVASGAITCGNAIQFVVDSYIAQLPNQSSGTQASGATTVGYALSTASDNERIPFVLDL